MPQYDAKAPTERATLEETLDFCNQVREAGGANPLDALMPAVPEDSHDCLIARNLNFSCEVGCYPTKINGKGHIEARSAVWVMRVEDSEVRRRIAAKLDLALVTVYEYELAQREGEEKDPYRTSDDAILLPKKIGQVAADFDEVWIGGEWRGSEFEPYIEESLREAEEGIY
jgi:hypothetical protein